MGCKKCGECCKWVYIEFDHEIFLRDIDELRGMEKVNAHTVRAPVHCKWRDAETGLCKHYEKRPLLCREFPKGNVYIPAECRYNED